VLRSSDLRFPYYERQRRRYRIRTLVFGAVAVLALWTIARAALGTGEGHATTTRPAAEYGTVESGGISDAVGSCALRVVVIEPGDTLWSIATRNYGESANVSTVVRRIARLNGLRGTVLQPGQQVALPRGVGGEGER